MYQAALITIISLVLLALAWFLPAYLWYYLCKKNWVKQRFTKIWWVYLLSQLVTVLVNFWILIVPAIVVFIFFPAILDSFITTLTWTIVDTIVWAYIGGFLLKKLCQIQFKLGFKIALITWIIVSILLGGLLVFKHFVISQYKFVWPSMGVIIQDGDIFMVNKTINTSSLERNSVIVFNTPNSDKTLVKRIIGLPWETVKNIDHHIKICTSNTTCTEEKIPYYIFEETRDICKTLGSYNLGSWYFVAGDDRNKSLDSRCCFSNNWCTNTEDFEVKPNNIIGKAWFKIWPEFKFIK